MVVSNSNIHSSLPVHVGVCVMAEQPKYDVKTFPKCSTELPICTLGQFQCYI
jgi:hypothetical protein